MHISNIYIYYDIYEIKYKYISANNMLTYAFKAFGNLSIYEYV